MMDVILYMTDMDVLVYSCVSEMKHFNQFVYSSIDSVKVMFMNMLM